jgi:restriction system protein
VAIPNYQTLMRPLLALHEDGGVLSQAQLRDRLAARFELSDEEREELLPSGTQRTFDNRVGWATTYLVRSGLLDRPQRARTRITDRGRQVLHEHGERVDNSVLAQFAEFEDFRARGRDAGSRQRDDQLVSRQADEDETPIEAMESAERELRSALAEELLARLRQRDDRSFEDVVLDVLVALGYGGSRREAAFRVGRSGDGGIDGVIQEDRLGLDVIYVQAKRWSVERKVGPREIREFMGALQDHEAHKGVFITTSSFSGDARDLARRRRIVLIDGYRLAELMIDAGVAVAPVRTFVIHRLDEDYFVDDDDGERTT